MSQNAAATNSSPEDPAFTPGVEPGGEARFPVPGTSLVGTSLLNSTIGIAVTDSKERFVHVNREFCRITGYSQPELLGLHWASVTYPEDRLQRYPLIDQLYTGELDSFVLEMRYITKLGDPIWVRTRTSAVRSSSGLLLYYVTLAEDISKHKRAEQNLRHLSGRMLKAQDEERRSLARELHDTTAQTLAGLSMNLSQLAETIPPSATEETRLCTICQGLAERAQREVRTISALLHPPHLEEKGLESTLRWLVHGFSSRSGIAVTLDIEPMQQRLPLAIELVLFRVVQECLSNVYRHSGSSTASVRLKRNPTTLVEVEDQGRGLLEPLLASCGRPLPGVGLQGMQERLRYVNGRLQIQSGCHGIGTLVRACVPLARSSY